MAYRIALAQVNTTVGDFAGNTRKIIASIEKAQQAQTDLIAFPELALCGYPPQDLLFNPAFIRENTSYLNKIIKAAKNISVVLGLVYPIHDNIYNAAAFINNQQLIDVYQKIILPNYGVFDEKRYFQAGDHYPVFRLREMIVGVNICEDIWHKNGPTRTQARLGQAQLVINISSSPYHERKLTERARMLGDRARENKVYLAYVNLVGGQDELVFDGGSMILGPTGRLIARGKEFAEDFIIADITPLKSGKQSVSSIVDPALKIFVCSSNARRIAKRPIKPSITAKLSDLAEVYQALVSGTRDYFRKNGFHKAFLGMSGGIDSALVAAIAADALGKENITALIMPSSYSAFETQRDAEIMARNLGITSARISITDIFRKYKDELRAYFAGRPEDITEENLQARIRGNILMMFSNKFGGLVLATGNKSELSVGYCTIYGDMVGGFAVIKDITKTWVYKLAHYYNRKMGQDIIPASIIERAPTAELRPNQKDEDSLPPYAVLDPILEVYIEQNKSIEDIVKSGFDPEVVRKVAHLVDINEYKRSQAPIGIKITRRAFGKDRRMPITNKFNV